MLRAPSWNLGPRNGGARAKTRDLDPSFDTPDANQRINWQAVSGDTLCLAQDAAKVAPLERAVTPKHMVFAGVYPTDGADFDLLADAIRKLGLSDTSINVEKESSVALGLGFRIGFLGALA